MQAVAKSVYVVCLQGAVWYRAGLISSPQPPPPPNQPNPTPLQHSLCELCEPLQATSRTAIFIRLNGIIRVACSMCRIIAPARGKAS